MCDYPECYWAEAARVYNWLAGSNELSLDLQQAKDVRGGGGGFYAGIEKSGTVTDSVLATTALALFAMVRASYIQIPEFTSVTTNVSSTTQSRTSTAISTSTITPEEWPPWLTAMTGLTAVGLLCVVGLVIFKFRFRTGRRKRRK
jgi:hypothetical protein